MMTTSGDLIKLIQRLIKVNLYDIPEADCEQMTKKIEAIVGKELDHMSSSSRSPFLQESKLREVVALHSELLAAAPRDYRLLVKLHNWVQYEVYSSPDTPDYDPLRSAYASLLNFPYPPRRKITSLVSLFGTRLTVFVCSFLVWRLFGVLDEKIRMLEARQEMTMKQLKDRMEEITMQMAPRNLKKAELISLLEEVAGFKREDEEVAVIPPQTLVVSSIGTFTFATSLRSSWSSALFLHWPG